MASAIVIAVYRPKDGQSDRLEDLLAEHVPTLRREELATARPVTLLRSPQDGSYLEVFEWISEAAPGRAHENPRVVALWSRISEVADVLPLTQLTGADRPFPQFEPVEGVVL